MQNNRKLATRIGAIALVLMLLLSFTASFAAATFTASKAGIKYGSSYKLGSTSTTWKSKLGSYSRKKYDACTIGVASYMYTFSSKGVKIETVVPKKGAKEQIISIILSKKTVPTIAGLRVGDKVSKMEQLYGTGYKKSGSTYTYTAGSTRMKVTTKSGKVSKITFIKD